MDIAMIDDQMLPMNELDKMYLDRGLYFGDGVYEVVRTYNGRVFALSEHLSRFARSLNEIQMTGVDIETIKQKILVAIEKAGHLNSKIYFHMTRGSQHRDHLPAEGLRPNFYMTVSELTETAETSKKGIAVSTHPDWRWKRCDIKSLNLLPNVLARLDAHKKGSSEAILVDDSGTITEGAGSAFFTINARDNAVITRPLGHEILPSITRAKVIHVAQRAGMKVIEKAQTPHEALDSDEMFIAVTTKDIIPVVCFDGQQIQDGRCGELTERLIRGFRELVECHGDD
jgi:D-alanine transaminase